MVFLPTFHTSEMGVPPALAANILSLAVCFPLRCACSTSPPTR
jgi:Na+/melibiose symporter-like transporter